MVHARIYDLSNNNFKVQFLNFPCLCKLRMTPDKLLLYVEDKTTTEIIQFCYDSEFNGTFVFTPSAPSLHTRWTHDVEVMGILVPQTQTFLALFRYNTPFDSRCNLRICWRTLTNVHKDRLSHWLWFAIGKGNLLLLKSSTWRYNS